MTQEAAVRGSQKILQQFAEKGQHLTIDDLKKAVALPAAVDYKFLRWYYRGRPADLYQLDATVETNVKNLGSVVDHFATRFGIADMNILINGLPYPELATVRIQVSEQGR